MLHQFFGLLQQVRTRRFGRLAFMVSGVRKLWSLKFVSLIYQRHPGHLHHRFRHSHVNGQSVWFGGEGIEGFFRTVEAGRMPPGSKKRTEHFHSVLMRNLLDFRWNSWHAMLLAWYLAV